MQEASGCGRLVGVKNWEASGCGRLVGAGVYWSGELVCFSRQLVPFYAFKMAKMFAFLRENAVEMF